MWAKLVHHVTSFAVSGTAATREVVRAFVRLAITVGEDGQMLDRMKWSRILGVKIVLVDRLQDDINTQI